MNTLQISGTLNKILSKQEGTGPRGNWVKQDFLIQTEGQYSKKILFSVFGQEKVNSIASLKVGDKIEVSFNAESKEHNSKYYTTLTAWKINTVTNSNTGQDKKEEDDLPF